MRACLADWSSGCLQLETTSVTVTSAISLLIALLSASCGGDTARFGALAAGTAFLVALIAFVAWLSRRVPS